MARAPSSMSKSPAANNPRCLVANCSKQNTFPNTRPRPPKRKTPKRRRPRLHRTRDVHVSCKRRYTHSIGITTAPLCLCEGLCVSVVAFSASEILLSNRSITSLLPPNRRPPVDLRFKIYDLPFTTHVHKCPNLERSSSSTTKRQSVGFLKAILDPKEYELVEAQTGEEGIRMTANENPAAVLLDLGLPDIDGVEVARRLRSGPRSPSSSSPRADKRPTRSPRSTQAPRRLPHQTIRQRRAHRAHTGRPQTFQERLGPRALHRSIWSQDRSPQSPSLSRRHRSPPHPQRVRTSCRPRSPRRQGHHSHPTPQRSLGTCL